MNLAEMDPFTLVLWGAAVLVAPGVCLPMLLALLGFTRVQIFPIAGPEAAESAGEGDPRYLDLVDRLRELGFEPQAVRVERGWFYLWYWARTSLPQPLFARPGRDCFATLYRLYRGDPWRLIFATIMTDDTLVTTANQIERLRIDRPGYWRRAHITGDPAELLRVHEETVAGFRVRGWTVAAPEVEEYCEVAARRTEEFLRESGKAKAFQCLQTALMLMLVGPLIAAFWLGYDHPAVPAVLIGCGLAYELLMPTTIRSGAEHIRREEQSIALANRWAQARRMGTAEPADREEGIQSAEQRREAAETIRVDPPPPWPPTDVTRPPEA